MRAASIGGLKDAIPAFCSTASSETHPSSFGRWSCISVLAGSGLIFQTASSLRAVAVAAILLASFAASAAERHALLIGINEYANKDVPNLRGAVNDVEAARQLLTSRLGFQAQDIVLLKDSQATRSAILTALNDLVGKVREDDAVYIHYSGHGSTVDDTNGDERRESPDDTKDETLMPHDARQRGVADITDDELNDALSRIQSSNVVVVLDSCYSGTATRSIGVATRGYHEDTRPDLYEQDPQVGTRAVSEVQSLTHLLLTGARDDQLALDGPVEGGSYQGFFSFALNKVLDKFGPEVTPLQIDDGVREVLLQLGRKFTGISMPEPQVEGANMAKPLFASASGGVSAAASRQYALVEQQAGGEVRLIGAVHMGGAPGSHWGIYPPTTNRFASGQQDANVKVDYTRGGDAFGRLDPPSARIATNARAVRMSAAPPQRDLPVAIWTRNSRLRSELTDEISRQLDGVRFVDDDEFSPFIVELPEPGTTAGVQEVVLLDVAGLHEGDRFDWTSADAVAKRLVTAFLRGSNVNSITSLRNPQSDMRVRAGVVGESATRAVVVVPQHQSSRYHIRHRDEARSHANSLMLDLECDRDCYLTLVDIDSEGGVTVLFPNGYQDPGFLRDGFVRGGRHIRIPDSIQSTATAGFYWDYAPPTGIDTIHIFATEKLETARKIRRYLSLADSGARSRSVFHDDIESLRGVLVPRPRGIAVVDDEPEGDAQVGDWTTASVTIEVVARGSN